MGVWGPGVSGKEGECGAYTKRMEAMQNAASGAVIVWVGLVGICG
jgi:hypothetical protein